MFLWRLFGTELHFCRGKGNCLMYWKLSTSKNAIVLYGFEVSSFSICFQKWVISSCMQARHVWFNHIHRTNTNLCPQYKHNPTIIPCVFTFSISQLAIEFVSFTPIANSFVLSSSFTIKTARFVTVKLIVQKHVFDYQLADSMSYET